MNMPAQRGMSLVTALLLLSLVAFLASIAFRVVPHYFDYMSLDKILLSVEKDVDRNTSIQSIQEFRTYVTKHMQVNGLRDLSIDEIMQIKLEDNLFKVQLKYEKREPLIRNLSIVAHFEKEYRLRTQ